MKYLLVTHISFRRALDGSAIVDALWAEDLRGLAAAVGQVTVAAPELARLVPGQSWGTGEAALTESDGIRFAGLPWLITWPKRWLGALRLRQTLTLEVRKADLIHSSNFFPPYLGLAYAHRLATRIGKKTLFVVAEDFVDFLTWNLAESGLTGLRRQRAERMIAKQDQLARECLRTATVSFLHTPAAVARYRLDAPHGVAIRQPVHEAEDVVTGEALELRLAGQEPLRLVAACRLEPLKGLDFAIRAVGLLREQGVDTLLDIYGTGSAQERLQKQIEVLGLQERVHLRDPLPPGAEFRAALAQHDVALMPHLTNDFGRAFWDAMAAGLPVVAFRSVASQDTVRHGEDGLLAPMADAEGLADVLRALVMDASLRMAMSWAARARALRNTKAIWNRIRLERILEAFPGEL